MTHITDTAVILGGIALLLLAGAAALCLLQIYRTVRDLGVTVRIFNDRLPTILRHLEEITGRVNGTTSAVHRQVEEIIPMVEKIKGMLVLLVGVEEVIRRRIHLPLVPALRTAAAAWKGVRVFARRLMGEGPKGP